VTARHHHYLSQCYLKGFSNGGSKKSKFTVIDLATGKSFETIPRNVGGIRDFNRIEIDGFTPDALENDLSQFEGQAATAINKLKDTLKFEGEVKDTILNLIALLSVRSPQMRAHFAKFQTEILERVMDLSLATEERWERQMEQMRRDGHDLKGDLTYKDIKEFHDKKQYKIEIKREFHIGVEMKMVQSIVPILGGRDWALLKATEDSGPFITNDNPVHLAWIDPDSVPRFYRKSPGFGLNGTRVYFPVSKELALSGEFEAREGTFSANRQLVSVLNSGLITRTYKQIYAPSLRFGLMSKDGNEISGGQFLKSICA